MRMVHRAETFCNRSWELHRLRKQMDRALERSRRPQLQSCCRICASNQANPSLVKLAASIVIIC
jgi:hypothetical protein